MAGSSHALRALFAGMAGLMVVAVAAEGCGGRDQLGAPFGEDSGPGPGPGVGGGDGGFGGDGGPGPGVGGFGGFGGMSSSSDVGPGPTTNVTASSVGPSTATVSTVNSVSSVNSGTSVTSVSSVNSVGVGGAGPTSSVSTINSVGIGGMGPGTITSVGSFVSVSSGGGGGNPLDCLTCLANNCPAALQCISNPTCVQGVVCSVQNCIGQGPDFVCILNCFNNDLQAALLALQTIGCVFNQCSAECQGLIGP